MIFNGEKRKRVIDQARFLTSEWNDSRIGWLRDNGVPKEDIEAYLRKEKKRGEIGYNVTMEDIDYLFSIGGVVCGGSVVSMLTKTPLQGDIDFYFKDELAYLKALLRIHDNPNLDIGWYIDEPYEIYDIGMCGCVLRNPSQIEVSDLARKALETGTTDILLENVYRPESTAIRLVKYKDRYGVNYRPEQILTLASLFPKTEQYVKNLLRPGEPRWQMNSGGW